MCFRLNDLGSSLPLVNSAITYTDKYVSVKEFTEPILLDMTGYQVPSDAAARRASNYCDLRFGKDYPV